MDHLVVPQGEFDLARFPIRKNDQLRAWDAADELVLEHVELGLDAGAPVLVVNGGHGAVAVALAGAGAAVSLFSDSFLDHVSTTENLRRNGLDPSTVTLLDPFALGSAGQFGVVLLKIPKSLALLEDELHRLRPHLARGATVVAAGMTKHIHTSTLQLIERVLGPTTTSHARKKARLIFCTPDTTLDPGESPWPATVEGSGAGLDALTMVNHANVFSRERLDIGTRFFLEHLPTRDDECDIVDLGCGNGVVGVEAARRCPEAHLTFVDESFMAVASAKATYEANVGNGRDARFVVGDTMFHLAGDESIDHASVDLVLNNPPFHDDHALSDAVAWQMFTEAHGALRNGGELWVVGNRHLAYHAKLKRIFGNCKVVASNSKFVVYRATK